MGGYAFSMGVHVFLATASPQPEQSLEGFLIWSGILVGVLVVGIMIVARVRRMLEPEDEDTPDGFTLHGLRELRARGQLTDAEFEHARTALIERIKSAAERDDAASAGR